jgi:glycosyltransferase involved in cell wall biosynthesis
MKILELNFERTWRGGERQTIYNSLGFKNAGHDVTILCRRYFPLGKKAQENNVATVSFSNIFSVLFFLITKGRKYDVMHVQTSHILTSVVFTKPFHRAKIIFTRRVDFVPKGWLTRIKYRMADRLVGVSRAVSDIISAFSRKEAVVISDVVVPSALNKENALQFLQQQGIDTGKHIIGTTAALVPHKDPLTMVAAINELHKMRQDFVFLHFGNGELLGDVKQKIADYHLKDHYKLCGFIDGVEDMFTLFEVFVMSSQEEGLGSSVLDAYQYKVPVVTTNAGGLADITSDGQAVVCNVHMAKELAIGINKILDSPEEFNAMKENAYNYVNQYHSMDYITKQYLELLK